MRVNTAKFATKQPHTIRVQIWVLAPSTPTTKNLFLFSEICGGNRSFRIYLPSLPGERASPEYLDTLIRGFISHGYGNDAVDQIRKIAGV
jgi:hypothetical protein